MTAHIIGFLGIAANMLIYQQKKGKNLLAFKLLSDILWAIHYLLLNANAAAAIACIGIFREFVFFNQDKKWAKSKLWFVFFMLCSITSAIFTWKNPFSILPAIASIISVISFWRNNPDLSRYLALPISISMLTYDISSSSYMGIANEIFTLISAFTGIIRHSGKKSF